MTKPPPTKSLPATPNGPHSTLPAQVCPAVGEPTGAARKGVPTALLPDPHPADGPAPIAWLTITAPGRGTTPTARSWCLCGRDLFAAGQRKVLALIADHTAHRDACPRRTTPQEGRTAA